MGDSKLSPVGDTAAGAAVSQCYYSSPIAIFCKFSQAIADLILVEKIIVD